VGSGKGGAILKGTGDGSCCCARACACTHTQGVRVVRSARWEQTCSVTPYTSSVVLRLVHRSNRGPNGGLSEYNLALSGFSRRSNGVHTRARGCLGSEVGEHAVLALELLVQLGKELQRARCCSKGRHRAVKLQTDAEHPTQRASARSIAYARARTRLRVQIKQWTLNLSRSRKTGQS
jgi:hypothetical protein